MVPLCVSSEASAKVLGDGMSCNSLESDVASVEVVNAACDICPAIELALLFGGGEAACIVTAVSPDFGGTVMSSCTAGCGARENWLLIAARSATDDGIVKCAVISV